MQKAHQEPGWKGAGGGVLVRLRVGNKLMEGGGHGDNDHQPKLFQPSFMRRVAACSYQELQVGQPQGLGYSPGALTPGAHMRRLGDKGSHLSRRTPHKSLSLSASVSLPVRLQAPPSFGEPTYAPLSLLGCAGLLAQAPAQNLQADWV